MESADKCISWLCYFSIIGQLLLEADRLLYSTLSTTAATGICFNKPINFCLFMFHMDITYHEKFVYNCYNLVPRISMVTNEENVIEHNGSFRKG